jgi:pilus assembly protein CpaE
MSPLELISPPLVDALFEGLRRNFALTIVDLPADWTAWTNRVLELADRIVLVTQLSVPHTHLVRRQISALQTQRLADKPLTLVCNAVNGDQQATVSLKAAERAIGRPFDVVVPEDRRLMSAAINQGLLIADVKRKTKVEKAIADLAGKIAAGAPVARPAGR